MDLLICSYELSLILGDGVLTQNPPGSFAFLHNENPLTQI